MFCRSILLGIINRSECLRKQQSNIKERRDFACKIKPIEHLSEFERAHVLSCQKSKTQQSKN